MIQKDINFIEKCKRKNKRVIAQYLALYTECNHLKKCMITITPPDNKLYTLLSLRKEFFKKLNRYKRNKKDGDISIKYFSNIEWTQSCIPHMHIQVFYTNIKPIKKAYDSVVNINLSHCNDLTIAENHNQRFLYVIKDYIDFDITIERIKAHYRGVKYISSSQKKVSNKIIRYLFRTIKFKTKNRYKEILFLLEQGKVQITKENTNTSINIEFTKLINKEKIGTKYVMIYDYKKEQKATI